MLLRQVGDRITGGDIYGLVNENSLIQHSIMLPPNARGNITFVAPAGMYNVEEEVIEVEFQGTKKVRTGCCVPQHAHARAVKPCMHRHARRQTRCPAPSPAAPVGGRAGGRGKGAHASVAVHIVYKHYAHARMLPGPCAERAACTARGRARGVSCNPTTVPSPPTPAT